MDNDCIFCRIVAGDVPSKKEYEDDYCISFRDINPRAKTHLLVIPKKHIPTLNDIVPGDEKLLGAMFAAARRVAEDFKMPSYKLLVSVGREAGQEVFHLHMHVMSPD